MSQYHATSTHRSRHRLGAGLLASAALVLGGLSFGPMSPAFAHDQLVGTELVTTDAGSPEAVKLSFNNNVLELGTEFIVTSASGDDVTEGDPEISGTDVTQQLQPELAEGDYEAMWHVTSSDSHAIEGTFTLSVAADGSATLAEAPSEDEHEHEHETATEDAASISTNDENHETPASFYVFLGIGGVLVVAVVIAAFMARSRRLAQMQRDAQPGNTGSDNAGQ